MAPPLPTRHQGLEAQLREAQALGSRQGSELQAAKDQATRSKRWMRVGEPWIWGG